jgi:hypothetical protein
MRVSWKWLAPAVAVTLLIACSEQSKTPTAVTPTAATTMAADYTNNPDGGGPWIARYTLNEFYSLFDSPDGLIRTWFTTFPLDGYLFGPDGTPWPWDNTTCGPPGIGAVNLQEISHWDPTHTDPSALYLANGSGSVWIVLTSRAPGAVGPCALRPLIASGWGTVKYNDNNESGSAANIDAWSFKVKGTLTMADGGSTVQYEGNATCVWNTGAKAAGYVCQTHINMR